MKGEHSMDIYEMNLQFIHFINTNLKIILSLK